MSHVIDKLEFHGVNIMLKKYKIGFDIWGITNAVVILGLTIPPCMAFLFFAIDRKNHISIVPISIFTICHFIYGVVNYII